jgi:hypothetical protein
MSRLDNPSTASGPARRPLTHCRPRVRATRLVRLATLTLFGQLWLACYAKASNTKARLVACALP